MKNWLKSTLQRFNASTLQRFNASRFQYDALLSIFIFLINSSIATSQIDSSAFLCGTEFGQGGGPESGQVCGNTSQYWTSNPVYLPNLNFSPLKVRVNLIILQRLDGSGNFQDNATDLTFLSNMMNVTNEVFSNLTNRNEEYFPGQNLPFLSNAKVEFVPNIIFRKDENGWNNRNDVIPGVPRRNNWYLDYLDDDIYGSPSSPKAINLYFTSDGQLHQQMVVLGTTTDYQNNVYFKQHSASEIPALEPSCGGESNFNDVHTMRCHIANVWLKLWWKRNVLGEPDWTMEYEAGESIAHELGHLMGLCHTPNSHLHAVMRTNFGGLRDYMTTREIGKVHRAFAIYPSLWQFVDCDATYMSSSAERMVTTNETWDLKMRLYSNVVVKAGATLTITCELLMPFDGSITVERGARLIIDGGNVRRANTCSPSQFWRGIVVQGNNLLAQPDPDGLLNANQAGVVLLRGNGMIEGAVIGAAAKGHPLWDVPQFRGGLIQANGFTFRDCRKGAEFMKYDPVNFSKFENVLFERTASGSMHTGVSIWDTDGILFEGCTFNNMASDGIVSWDAAFNVTKKNRFVGSERGILAGASNALNGFVRVGSLGLIQDDRNKFENNVVGIRATANSKVQIFSNDFENFNFDVAINGNTESYLTDNFFASGSAGNQFENTGNNANHNLCNTYSGNIVGTNVIGGNFGFLFREEDFTTDFHDLFIEPFTDSAPFVPGEIQNQGSNGFAAWNYFTPGKPENIKTSTILPPPMVNTKHFFYFHPNPNLNARVKPKCSLSDVCMPQSNFTNIQTFGEIYSDCMFPESPQEQPCTTKACLDVLRIEIAQKNSEYAANPTPQLAGEIQVLVSQRERITSELIRQYIAGTNWTAVETLLNEDLNPANRRRLVAAKLEQNQFTAANGLLQAFPQNTLDDQYFVQVQGINAARLSNPEFTLNAAQEETLLGIANSSSQEAGYAQSILGILTGRTFMPRLPNLTGERSDAPLAAQPSKMGVLQVAPNPANETILVQLPKQVQIGAERVLELRDIATGILVQQVQAPDDSNVSLSVQTTPSGIYILSLLEKGVVVARQKITIQH
ncbi:MAG: hypothetical protein J0M29_03345 [Chitinophagales bacterium]|nr:hypothetical protein [Chitinophagales bacterium]